jgi:toxin ParE1/3/4
MAVRIIRSKTSVADLEEIWQFIARDSEFQADRWVRILNDRIVYLAGHNSLGRPRPELAADLRSSPIKDYVIFYRPIHDGLIVVRVLHSSRDIRHDLFE